MTTLTKQQQHLVLTALKGAHILILLFTLIGWALPSQHWVIAHAVAVAGMLIHWKTNEQRCILSEVESKLKGVPPPPPGGGDSPFVRWFLERFLNMQPPKDCAYRLSYSVTWTALALSVLRLIYW